MVLLTMVSLSTEKYTLTIASLLCASNVCVAFMDVLVDSLMVVQARDFPDEGSEELQSFSWMCLSMGGIVCAFAAAILT